MSANRAKRQIKLKIALADEELANELDLVIEEVNSLNADGINKTISDEVIDRESADIALDSRISMLENETVLPSGMTSDRPSDPLVGQVFLDTTLGKVIIYSGSAWINFDGTPL